MLSHFHFVYAGSIPVMAILWDNEYLHGAITTTEQREYLEKVKEVMYSPSKCF